VGKIAVIPSSNEKHPHDNQRQARDQVCPAEVHDEDRQRKQMNYNKWQA
jgi:hypothetical protein